MVHAAFTSLLDPHAVRAVLATPLPVFLGTDLVVTGCEILHARCRTFAKAASSARTFLTFVYSIALGRSDRPGDVLRHELVHGRATLEDRGARAPHVLTVATPPLWIELRRFPDDLALPQLATLADPRRVLAAMPAEARACVAHGAVDVRVASFRPGERCTIAYADARGAARVYAKTYADGQAPAVAHRIAALAQHAASGRLLVPRLLGVDAERGAIWQAAVEGTAPLASLDADRAHTTLTAVAEALAELHAGPAVAPRVARSTRLEEAERKARKLERAEVVAGADLRHLLDRCAHALPQLAPERFELRHGDAHLGQFLLAGARVAMFDCDELACGDLEEDLAALAVQLEDLVAAGRCAPGAVDALLSGYRTCAAAPRVPDPALYAFHYRLQRLDRAYRDWWRRGAAAVVDARRSLALGLACAGAPA